MLESWREVKGDLRLLRETTRLDSAPTRVEMRLKQELRTRREARVPRSTVAIAVLGAGCSRSIGGKYRLGADTESASKRHRSASSEQPTAGFSTDF